MEKKEILDVSIIAMQESPEERSTDFCPKTFDDYLGQKNLKISCMYSLKLQKMRQEHSIIFFCLTSRRWQNNALANYGTCNGCRN